MKTILAGLLATFLAARAMAQVSVELSMEQEQFLPSETVPLTVKITNRSGQTLHLGADADWLTFNVESADGYVVIKNAEVPVVNAFDLETSQEAVKRVDLQPYFSISKPGRYRVVATLRIRDWAEQIASEPKGFDVIHGAELWSQDFGVPNPDGGPPEGRRYLLEQANYLKEQLRLYVQVSDASGTRVYKVTPLGAMVSFSHTEAQVDRQCRLNVLWQTGANTFSHTIVNSDGTVFFQEYLDNFTSRPRLTVNGDGEVLVLGGTKRLKPGEFPMVKSPLELPPMTNLPAAAVSTNPAAANKLKKK